MNENKKKYDVICVGAALVDMAAQVTRHPKSDDEVFVSRLDLLSGGAAANTAHACAKLGLNSSFLGKIGKEDQFGKKILSDFRKVGIHLDLIKQSNQFGTGSAYVAVDSQGDRRIYAHSGAADKLSENDIKSQEISKTKILYLSSLKNIKPFIKAGTLAQEHNIPVILNPGMLIVEQGLLKIKRLLRVIDILIISQREFKTLMKLTRIDKENLIEQSQELLNLGIQYIIITLGEKGAILLNKERFRLFPPYPVKEVKDTTGAGDAFSTGFIYGINSNYKLIWDNLLRCVKLGNYVASSCIQKFGARNGIPVKAQIPKF